jgi:hypothetical protein
MFADPSFWEDEKDSPLLARNHGFVTPENAALRIARVQAWPFLVGAQPCDPSVADQVTKPDFLRIIARDADRTFIPKDDPEIQKRTAVRQEIHCRNLKVAYHEIQDYHQGLGYIGAFLALFLDTPAVGSILLALHRSEHHSRGYFLKEPQAFVGDARAMNLLLAREHPEVAARLQKWGVVPEMYMVKWFCGLGVHVLPYEYLFDYFELYFRFGTEFVFKFALAYVEHFSEHLLAANGTPELMTTLRAEDSHSEWNLPAHIAVVAFENVLAKALLKTLDTAELSEMRKAQREKVRQECEIATARLKQLEDEDESDGINFTDDDD